jgi:hypothetical protein
MNKLRELIKANSDAWDAYDAWDSTGQADNEKFAAYGKTWVELQRYFFLNRVEIADLIDAAKAENKLVDELANSIDCDAEDVGGCRPTILVLSDLWPAQERLEEIIAKLENDK